MYYPHFGLQQPPFKITPNTDFFFSGGNRGAILDALVYAIENGEGIIKVVGEVGSGKTMLCRMLQTILPEKIESIYLANPSVAPEDVLHAIAFELQLPLPKDADRLNVMHALQAHLLSRHAEGRQVVIFVEEAQGMPIATLEEIRLLSNLETKQDKLLQIVLFGQPELDENLNQEQIRQLRERITHRFNLGPLHTKDVGEYLIFRLRAAGYHGPHLFTDASIKKLSNAAQGLVRRVNILADKALLAAFADNVYQVTPKHVTAAIQDSEFAESAYGQRFDRYKPFVAWGIFFLVILAVGVFATTQWQRSVAEKSKSQVTKQQVGVAIVAPVVAPSVTKPAPVQQALSKPSVAEPIITRVAADQPVLKKPEALERESGPAAASASLAIAAKQSAVAVTKTPVGVNGLPALNPVSIAKPLQLGVGANKPQALASGGSIVNQRIDAMNKLLQRAKPETVLLQIKSIPAALSLDASGVDRQLAAELESLGQQVELDNIYLYRMHKKDGVYTVVLYGTYSQRADALEALKSLPDYIKNSRPYLRTLAGINSDLALTQ